MNDLEKFARFLIAQHANRSPVTFPRVAEELVCLAFDLHTQCLVELHVLNRANEFTSADRESFRERVAEATELTGPCFCRIIDVGEHDGMCYYATTVNDGEFLKDYVERVAPVDVPLALSMVIELCDAVTAVQKHPRLMGGLKLSNLLVTRVDDSHVSMRILDLGIAVREDQIPAGDTLPRKMAELSQILFFLLAGQRYVGNAPSQVNALAGLPASLKVLLRQTLDGRTADPATGAVTGPTSLQKYRDELVDSYGAVSQKITRTSGFRALAAPPRLHPTSLLDEQFFGDIDLEDEIGDRYQIIDKGDLPLSPYARLAQDLQKDRETVVQFLPAARTLPVEHSQRVIRAMSQINEEEHPDLIRCRGFWETDQLSCIAEEPHNGFGLPLLIAERGQLEPPEIIILMRRIAQGMRQAAAIGLTIQNLSTHSLEVHFPQESRFRVRELRKRHVDFWPEFRLKLRCHATLESAVRVPPSGRLKERAEPTPEWLEKSDFVALAEAMVIGTKPPPSAYDERGAAQAEAEHIAALRAFFAENYRAVSEDVAGFEPEAFVDALEAELARVWPSHNVENVGTIVDGAIAVADAAGRAQSKRTRSAHGTPQPMGVRAAGDENGQDSLDEGDDALNPIAAQVREGGAAAAEPESLGTIDDLDYDIGDSRDRVAPLPLGTIGSGEDAEEEETDDPETKGKRKGWFFLR